MFHRSYPQSRLRRSRSTSWLRQLTHETRLHPADLVWPCFVQEGQHSAAITALPGQNRWCLDDLLGMAEQAALAGIKAIALFPVTAADKKCPQGQEALNPNNLINRCLQALKREQLPLGLIADVALDPYTSHGHDGLINAQGHIDNDASIAVLAQQALLQAQMGADIVAPSDMQDGRIALIRQTLEEKSMPETTILSYTAKYASHFYGPFRAAIAASPLGQGSPSIPSDKQSYQMQPHNRNEALHAARQQAQEGADALMVKPAMPYLDIIQALAQDTHMPIFAYQVSGEYGMLKHLAAEDDTQERALFYESLIACKRAGSQAILSYYALEMAHALKAELVD